MKSNDTIVCRKCNGNNFVMKREATYLYTYKLDKPITKGWSEGRENLPFLFDNREKVGDNDYLECENCGEKYSCDLDNGVVNVQFTIEQKAIRSEHVENPEFLG
ncbi:hypothetical protein [Oceanirhabdus sp. W0125-5]|uniref:hypothetical protein n=1 Tax=Oceanirhabdus sp. W0125-5 TaxID=2999116 RepID=UPI0022F2C72A|nr:hypothetical protein [Oceanirhabdus sp. W0125-5]WBW99121.1 hypothetical protein OW730_10350 [Oceanirhabdus sp. W0125-5]